MHADTGEVLDLVERKGPISLDGLMDQQAVYSRDDVYIALVELSDEGKVRNFDGDLEEHGTTRELWEATTDDDEDEWRRVE